MVFNTLRKYAKKARGKVIKRYFKKKSGYAPKIGRMYKDIQLVKGMLNAEKKQISQVGQALKLGQLNVSASGYLAAGITPSPIQGSGQGMRTGNSIKICSSWFLISIWQQASLVTNMKFKFLIIKPKTIITGDTGLATFVSQIMEPTPYNGLIDYNSQFNPNYYGTYTIVYKRTYDVRLTNYATATTVKEIKIPMKWNHHIRFAADGSQTLADGQLIMLCLADSGNCGGTAAAGSINAPVLAPNSGVVFNYDFNYFYYNN